MTAFQITNDLLLRMGPLQSFTGNMWDGKKKQNLSLFWLEPSINQDPSVNEEKETGFLAFL